MVPAAILAEIGASIGDITAWASTVPALARTAEIALGSPSVAGRFFRFASAIRKYDPGLSWPAISEAWRAAKYWYDPGQYLRQLDPNVVIDPRLAQRISVEYGSESKHLYYGYRYDITIQFPGESQPKLFRTVYHGLTPLSGAQSAAEAIEDLVSGFKHGSKPSDDPDVPGPVVTGAKLIKVYKYEYSGV